MNTSRSTVRAQPDGSRREWFLWLSLIAVVVISRAPNLFFDPRFWAEEATVYFSYARQSGALASLLFIPTGYPSYLNLSVNIPATLAASLLPLHSAPLVTTFWAFVMQMTPFVLVFFGRSRIWETRAQRILVAAILLFGPPAVIGEVWLNSTNSQVFAGITGVILLCERTDGRSKALIFGYRAILILCALSGPYTAFLAPAFFLKARIERSPEAKRQAWIVVTAVLVQAGAHVLTRVGFAYSPSRLAGGYWGSRVTALFFNEVLYTFLGYDLAPIFARKIGILQVVRQSAESVQFMRLAGWVSLLCLILYAWWSVRHLWKRFDVVLPVAFVSLTIPLYYLTPTVESRYVVVPGTVLLLTVVSCAQIVKARGWRTLCGVAVAFSIASGVATYWRDVPRNLRPLGQTLRRPSWTSEVARWREDHYYRLRIWPFVGRAAFRLHLNPPSEPTPPGSFLEVEPFSLISRGDEVTRVVPVSGLPPDFRMVVKMRSTQPAKKTTLRLILEDGSGRRLNTTAIRGFDWHEHLWVDFVAREISLRRGAQFNDVRRIRFFLDTKADIPHRVSFERFSIQPSNVGALEHLLPSRPLPRLKYRFENSERATVVEDDPVAETR